MNALPNRKITQRPAVHLKEVDAAILDILKAQRVFGRGVDIGDAVVEREPVDADETGCLLFRPMTESAPDVRWRLTELFADPFDIQEGIDGKLRAFLPIYHGAPPYSAAAAIKATTSLLFDPPRSDRQTAYTRVTFPSLLPIGRRIRM